MRSEEHRLLMLLIHCLLLSMGDVKSVDSDQTGLESLKRSPDPNGSATDRNMDADILLGKSDPDHLKAANSLSSNTGRLKHQTVHPENENTLSSNFGHTMYDPDYTKTELSSDIGHSKDSKHVNGLSRKTDLQKSDQTDTKIENNLKSRIRHTKYPEDDPALLKPTKTRSLKSGTKKVNNALNTAKSPKTGKGSSSKRKNSNRDPAVSTMSSAGNIDLKPVALKRQKGFLGIGVLKSKRSLANGFNHTWPIKRVAETEGDIILGGLMMVHEREDRRICGPIMPQGGIQALECMLYTMDWVNAQKNFLPGIKLGAYILDDCDKDTYGLEQAVDFIKGSISNIDDGTYRCPDGTFPAIRHKRITGVLGAASSVTSIQVANLLRLFRIPQVSFFSTSPELSNKQRFEYFMRTVPSDTNQADAMVKIVLKLGWTYVSILYEESNYGIQAFTVLEQQLSKKGICIAVKERLTKDSGVAGDPYYDGIVEKLMTKHTARGVIIFASDQEVAGVMRAIRRNNCTGIFSWIGSDGWSARSLVFDGNEDEVEGTISVQPRAHPVAGFDNYFKSLTVENNRRNPWFTEFWEHFFNCKWPGSAPTPYNQLSKVNCTGQEVMSQENGYEAEKQLQFVSDSVLAFAHALRSLHADKCGGSRGICPRMRPVDGATLLAYLKNVTFKGLSGDEFQFSQNGDGPARYNIIHFKQTARGIYKWVRVGEYREGELDISLINIRFRLDEPHVPISVCSQPCGKAQAKKFVEGGKCCWHCFNCTKYQILKHETTCLDCPLGSLPNEDHSECEIIPSQYMRLDSYWAISVMSIASVGILLTLFVTGVFYRYGDTPVVKASGKELSYVLLAGIFLCYAITFLIVQKPSDIKCGAQKIGIGLCFAIVYSAVLTKTNRINRIFKSGARSTKRPSFISPKSQLIICGAMVSVQLLFSVMWMAFSPPKAMLYHPTMDESHLVCAASMDASYIVAFAYPMILIIVCTIYAILTRKIPEAFNESKYIGFTMYTTCIVWLAFIPLYFTTTDHGEMNVFTMSVTVSISATVTLFCLFTPKLYIILLHPERNIRQPLMNQSKYVGANGNRVGGKMMDDEFSDTSRNMNDFGGKSNPIPLIQKRSCGTQTEEADFLQARIFRCVSCTVIETMRHEDTNMRL